MEAGAAASASDKADGRGDSMTARFSARVLALALPVLAASAAAGLPASPAAAEGFTLRNDRERYVSRFCDRNPRADGCRDWRDNRRRWGDDRYRDWYRRNHRDNDDAAAAALFGLAAGALLGATVPNALGGGGLDVTEHVRRCEARYRSYDPASDTYLGYDGIRHRCRL
jgi:hypothetical protein